MDKLNQNLSDNMTTDHGNTNKTAIKNSIRKRRSTGSDPIDIHCPYGQNQQQNKKKKEKKEEGTLNIKETYI